MNEFYHRPVMVEEVASYIVTRPGGLYVDLTCGGGGHLARLSEALDASAELIGMDRDPEAVAAAEKYLRAIPQRLRTYIGKFSRLEEMAATLGIGPADGFLVDLGVSSHQIDVPDRGFSYMHDGPLDMRMGPDADLTAGEIINSFEKKRLAEIFRIYGEEKRAEKCARAIVAERKKGLIKSVFQLVEILRPIFRPHELNSSLARIFQALRIVVNNELEELRALLPKAVAHLRLGGRMVVISYHSLEDRIVKRFMTQKARGCVCPPALPICACGAEPQLKILTKKPTRPSPDEIRANVRARSARLRAAERIA
jgi:16S rRNA (cytosine1402-N4)-methyltransferase